MNFNFSALLALFFYPYFYSIGNIGRGEEVYKQICFNCHGPNLGGGIGPSLIDSYWKHGDSPEAMLQSIAKGITGTEMIAYELAYPKDDLIAVRDFILSKQEGMRSVFRSVYPREFFEGRRLKPELFDSVESLSQSRLPENVYYMERSVDGVLRGKAKLHIKDPGDYQLITRPIGRTSIYINGQEMHYSDQKTDQKTHLNKKFKLTSGIHDLEILHEEKTTHSYRFYGYLQHIGGKRFPLNGKSLEGSAPKFIKATPQAIVIRKWIKDLPPRSLLCLLPNRVLIAYDPTNSQIVKVWSAAEINQTPSLPGRSQNPSELKGQLIPDQEKLVWKDADLEFLHYQTLGEQVQITSLVNGKQKTLSFIPKGTNSFSLTIQ
ncbi:MAG: cytochrome c [Opitutales bacterium]|jgi:outer membrane lipoprotein-sorting protein